MSERSDDLCHMCPYKVYQTRDEKHSECCNKKSWHLDGCPSYFPCFSNYHGSRTRKNIEYMINNSLILWDLILYFSAILYIVVKFGKKKHGLNIYLCYTSYK